MRKLFYLTLISCCSLLSVTSQSNYLDNYINNPITLTTIGNTSNQINQPVDLDFKTNSNELWVAQYGTSAGGNMVIFYNAGLPSQTHQYRKDTHSGHFMIYTSAMTFGDQDMWAATSEIQNTASPTSTFMGPALWSADTAIFARVFQNNWVTGFPLGSHYDMLHQSPFAMGIAHDSAMIYWVMDGHNGNIVKYDFVSHHGPGYDNHSAGKIWRYIDVPVSRVAGVPSHMELDKSTGWLYFINGGTKEIKRLNTNSGSVTGTLSVPSTASEPLAGYWKVEGSTVEILDSLTTQPCGLDIYNGRMIVSDFTTGDIYLYDISGPVTILDTIVTGQAGMMGIKVGPDGHIWCVNKGQNKVYRLDIAPPVVDVAVTAITSPAIQNFVNNFYSTSFDICNGSIAPSTTIYNSGSTVVTSMEIHYTIDGGTSSVYNWVGNLPVGGSTTVDLHSSAVTNGSHLLSINVVLVNGSADEIDKNNIFDGAFRSFNAPVSFVFSEGFSNVTFPPSGFNYINYNKYNRMTRVVQGGFGLSSGSMKMDNFSGAVDITGQKDYLMLPLLDFTLATANTQLTFNVAHAQYTAATDDELQIVASTDCGGTWQQLYSKAGATLATAPIASSSFTPTVLQWRTDSVSLATLAGESEVILMLTSVSNYGNNLYVDDINIAISTAGLNDQSQINVNVFPNPATSLITIQSEFEFDNAEFILMNALGEVQSKKHVSNVNSTQLDVADLANGVYFINIQSSEYSKTIKIIVKH